MIFDNALTSLYSRDINQSAGEKTDKMAIRKKGVLTMLLLALPSSLR